MKSTKFQKRKRSTRPRRKVRKNRVGGRAKTSQLQVFNKMPDKPLRYVKSIYGFQTLVGVAGPIYQATSFTVGSLPDFNDIAILFNRYKLNRVTATFTLRSAAGSAGGLGNSTQLPKLFVRYNYDANITAANIPQTLQEVNNVICHSFTEDSTVLRYTCVPRTIAPVYRSALLTGYELQKKSYIDCAYSDVPHYGLMIWVPYLAAGDEILIDYTYDFVVKYQM